MNLNRNVLSKHIVIGGLPRSGTSFIRAIIGSHPDIAIYKWELPFWTQLYPKFGNTKLRQYQLNSLLDELLDSYTITKSDIIFNRAEIEEYLNKLNEQPRACDIYQFLLEKYRTDKKKKFVGIKTPFNENWAVNIFDHFPNTKFIHVIRNPVDVARSLKLAKEKWWGGQMSYFRHIYEWKTSVKLAKFNSVKYPDQYMILKYDYMVKNPIPATRELCLFLEINFDESMLKMESQPGWKGQNTSFEKSDKPGIEQIDKHIVTYYENLVGKLMEDLGYISTHRVIKQDYLLKLRFGAWSIFYRLYLAMVSILKRFSIYINIRL